MAAKKPGAVRWSSSAALGRFHSCGRSMGAPRQASPTMAVSQALVLAVALAVTAQAVRRTWPLEAFARSPWPPAAWAPAFAYRRLPSPLALPHLATALPRGGASGAEGLRESIEDILPLLSGPILHHDNGARRMILYRIAQLNAALKGEGYTDEGFWDTVAGALAQVITGGYVKLPPLVEETDDEEEGQEGEQDSRQVRRDEVESRARSYHIAKRDAAPRREGYADGVAEVPADVTFGGEEGEHERDAQGKEKGEGEDKMGSGEEDLAFTVDVATSFTLPGDTATRGMAAAALLGVADSVSEAGFHMVLSVLAGLPPSASEWLNQNRASVEPAYAAAFASSALHAKQRMLEGPASFKNFWTMGALAMKCKQQPDRVRLYLFERVVDGMVSTRMAASDAWESRACAAVVLCNEAKRWQWAAREPHWAGWQRDRLRRFLTEVRLAGDFNLCRILRCLLVRLGEPGEDEFADYEESDDESDDE